MTDPTQFWFVPVLRFTGFVESGQDPLEGVDGYWANIFQEVDYDEKRERKGQFKEVRGNWKNQWQRIIRSSPNRLDVISEAILSPRQHFSELKKIRSEEEVVKVFSDRICRFLEEVKPNSLNRLAYALDLLWSVNSREEGYRFINDKLHAVTLSPDSSDFNYQINHPTRIQLLGSSEEVKCNRLTAWSVSTKQSFILSGGGAEAGDLKYAVNLKMDINTDAERKTSFQVDQLSGIMTELAEIILAITEEGEPK